MFTGDLNVGKENKLIPKHTGTKGKKVIFNGCRLRGFAAHNALKIINIFLLGK